MAGKFEKKSRAGAPEWMGTYSDLVTLLLCFFILLFAFSTIDSKKYTALQQAFTGDSIVGTENSTQMTQHLTEEVIYQNQLNSLEKQIKDYVKDNKISDEVSIKNDGSRITIHFNSSMFFDKGSADIKEVAKPHIKSIVKTFPTDFNIQIEGHTDNVPVNNEKFSSNWDLSVARGVNVLKYMIDNCNIKPNITSAAGYGEYKPIASNDTEEGRQENRRVDIILFKADKTQKSS